MARRWKWISVAVTLVLLYVFATFVPWGGMTLLARSARAGSCASVRLLLALGARPNQASAYRDSPPLVYAVANGHVDVIRALLGAGADPNAVDVNGMTALCIAGQTSRIPVQVFQALLDGGADPNHGKFTALQCLHAAGNAAAKARTLLDHGAMIDGRDTASDSPLAVAAMDGHEEVLQLLLQKKAAINRSNDAGRTPLMQAADRGQRGAVKLLLQAGADARLQDRNGQTALGLAIAARDRIGALKEEYAATIETLRTAGSADHTVPPP